MATYYVKADDQGFVAEAPALEEADGLVAVNVPMTSIDYFLRYYTKYALNGTTLTAPGNLPDLNIDYLREIVDRQGKQLETAQSTVTQLQQLSSQSAQAQAALANDVANAKATITQLQELANQLTQQMAALSIAQANTATETEATTKEAE